MTIHKAKQHNGKDCILLDVVPTLDGKSFVVYDITLYLKASNGLESKRMIERSTLTIKGKSLDVLLIDWHEKLDYETGKKLAIWYVSQGHNEVYRLD